MNYVKEFLEMVLEESQIHTLQKVVGNKKYYKQKSYHALKLSMNCKDSFITASIFLPQNQEESLF